MIYGKTKKESRTRIHRGKTLAHTGETFKAQTHHDDENCDDDFRTYGMLNSSSSSASLSTY